MNLFWLSESNGLNLKDNQKVDFGDCLARLDRNDSQNLISGGNVTKMVTANADVLSGLVIGMKNLKLSKASWKRILVLERNDFRLVRIMMHLLVPDVAY